MAGIAHVGSMSTGHNGFHPRPLMTGSSNVNVNGIPVSRISDNWQIHCDDDTCHSCNQATGSSTVFVNGIPLARIGDATGCGDNIASGSSNTFSG
jgi:uncharacterized Zn-binding protein involved in type VI secretion